LGPAPEADVTRQGTLELDVCAGNAEKVDDALDEVGLRCSHTGCLFRTLGPDDRLWRFDRDPECAVKALVDETEVREPEVKTSARSDATHWSQFAAGVQGCFVADCVSGGVSDGTNGSLMTSSPITSSFPTDDRKTALDYSSLATHRIGPITTRTMPRNT
jgi:hypothetical protein